MAVIVRRFRRADCIASSSKAGQGLGGRRRQDGEELLRDGSGRGRVWSTGRASLTAFVRALCVLVLLASCATPTATPETALQATALPTEATTVVFAEIVAEPDSGAGRYRVDFVVENASDLYGAEFHATLDLANVQVLDGDPNTDGTQMTPGTAFEQGNAYVALNQVDEATGKVDLAATLLGQVEPLQGRLVLASMSVQALAQGPLTVTFNRVVLADAQANRLDMETRDAAFDLTP